MAKESALKASEECTNMLEKRSCCKKVSGLDVMTIFLIFIASASIDILFELFYENSDWFRKSLISSSTATAAVFCLSFGLYYTSCARSSEDRLTQNNCSYATKLFLAEFISACAFFGGSLLADYAVEKTVSHESIESTLLGTGALVAGRTLIRAGTHTLFGTGFCKRTLLKPCVDQAYISLDDDTHYNSDVRTVGY